ncbi:MAG: molecular chaperone TorD family protein [Burkholderiales bacterium]
MSSHQEIQVCADGNAIAARSKIYQTLSAIFMYPDTDEIAEFVLNGAQNALKEAAAFLPFKVPAIDTIQPCSVSGKTELGAIYTRLFDNCGGSAMLSLHEKDYGSGDPKTLWEDLIRFYEYFGISYQLGINKEWPDWIGIEFEFAHFLSYLEAGSDEDQSSSYLSAQSDFLERHLGRWIPKFSVRLAKKAPDTPYALYADAMAEFVSADLQYNLARRPRLQAA